MLDIRVDRPYLFTESLLCRHCGLIEEDIEHIINCFHITTEVNQINEHKVYEQVDTNELEKVSRLAKMFLDKEED